MCIFLCMLFACTLQRVWPRGARNSLLPARRWRRPKARLKNHLVDINGGQDFFPNFECYYKVFRCKKRLIYKYIYTILYSEYMYIRTHTHNYTHIPYYTQNMHIQSHTFLFWGRSFAFPPSLRACTHHPSQVVVPGRAARYDDAIRRELHDPMVSNDNESVKKAQSISTKFRQILESVFWSLMLVPVWWVCEPSSPVLTVLLRSESGAH